MYVLTGVDGRSYESTAPGAWGGNRHWSGCAE